MENYVGIGSEIIKGGIFERFPELVPQGGENYWQGKHKKLLLVGESNYFKNDMESKSDFKSFEKWYKGENSLLIPEEMKKNVHNWKSGRGFNNLFKSMKKVFEEEGITDYKANPIEEVLYYNYFLRPASVKNKNRGFEKDCKPIDCEVAYSALCGIIKEKGPNIVIFVSKFAFDKFMEFYEKQFENVKIEYVNHFSRACWHEENGQQKFENLLRDHWVKKNPNHEKLKTIHNSLQNIFKEETYKPNNCGIWGENFLSSLFFKIENKTFCCETGVKINSKDYWTCFYETDNCEKIPALVGKDYKFTPDVSNDTIVVKIENQIRHIIVEIEKVS